MTCKNYEDTRWVCEDHPNRPWGSGRPNACRCGGAGMPCPVCNEPKEEATGNAARTSRLTLIATTGRCTESLKKMCGRFTYQLTWEEIFRLYGLTLDIGRRRNLKPRYNVCPTTDIDAGRGRRELMTMRWASYHSGGTSRWMNCGRQPSMRGPRR